MTSHPCEGAIATSASQGSDTCAVTFRSPVVSMVLAQSSAAAAHVVLTLASSNETCAVP